MTLLLIYLKQNEAVNKGLANQEIEEKAPAKFGLKTNQPMTDQVQLLIAAA